MQKNRSLTDLQYSIHLEYQTLDSNANKPSHLCKQLLKSENFCRSECDIAARLDFNYSSLFSYELILS